MNISLEHYWLCLFTGTSWQQFLNADRPEVGFNAGQIKQAQKMKPGDKVVAYLTKVSRFVAILEVTSEAVVSDKTKWTEGLFPVRIGAKVLQMLPVPNAIPMNHFLGKLSFLMTDEMPVSGAWSAHVRSSPRRCKTEDGAAVSADISKVIETGQNPNLTKGITRVSIARKRNKTNKLNRVGSLIRRSKKLDFKPVDPDASFRVLSRNQVTGYAVNFPIQKTCRPTAVCRDTCYFAVKLNASLPALTLQHRNLELCVRDPEAFAQKVIYEYDNTGINYLRWNGGGDLFEEAIVAIDYIGSKRPDIVLWIVSRKAELAAQLKPNPNHYIHLSLDRTLIDQKSQIRSMFKHENVHFSYQVHPDETLSEETASKVDLIFLHDYAPIPEHHRHKIDKFCPLNGAESITDACGQCRRCFDGSLIEVR